MIISLRYWCYNNSKYKEAQCGVFCVYSHWRHEIQLFIHALVLHIQRRLNEMVLQSELVFIMRTGRFFHLEVRVIHTLYLLFCYICTYTYESLFHKVIVSHTLIVFVRRTQCMCYTCTCFNCYTFIHINQTQTAQPKNCTLLSIVTSAREHGTL